MIQFRRFIKYLLSKFINIRIAERLYHNIIWREILEQKKPDFVDNVFGAWDNKRIRYKLWDKINKYLDSNNDVIYIEFGVYKGESINYFSKIFSSKNSKFYGFDSFYGLPEKWQRFEQGAFSTDGKEPLPSDSRIKFVKGLFQDTLPNFLNNLSEESKKKIFLIHFDADLYSSTLFTLFKMHEYKNDFYFLFDQFGSDECRAFFNFSKATAINYELFYVTNWNYGPQVVFGKIKSKDG